MTENVQNGFDIAGFSFISNFDSANLSKVELVPRKPIVTIQSTNENSKKQGTVAAVGQRTVSKPAKQVPCVEIPDFEFNIWTNPDCHGTQFENSNRTWFHFGIRGGPPFSLVKLNIVDLNKQGRMYRDGMAPVFRVCPGRQWERVRDKPVYNVEDNIFTLSFKFRTLENPKAVTYFAFTYPFSYTDLLVYLSSIDVKLGKGYLFPKSDIRYTKGLKLTSEAEDNIYYHREVACFSLENRRVELITVSSHHNITEEREPRFSNLFPDETVPRCFKFSDKKVIFVSARVHPGETPSSFVLNGLLNFLISRDDPLALLLRRQYVFKIIPMLNPDGVVKGHYRTDTRGANLNRFYLKPDVRLHPSIYAARTLICYYHFGQIIPDSSLDERYSPSDGMSSPDLLSSSTEILPLQDLSIRSSHSSLSSEAPASSSGEHKSTDTAKKSFEKCHPNQEESGLFLYLDMHGHASKKGIFMYGNHFDNTDDSVDCMLFPKLLSLNSQNFHFGSCNFTERNMYLKDKRDGTSREGSGRVAVLRLTGLVRSYTLECNYNTGRIVNSLPQCCRELPGRAQPNLLSPPKYNPSVYEEVGRAIGVSILDLTNSNPWSRVPNSEYHTIAGVREWLRIKVLSDLFIRTGTIEPRVKRNNQVVSSRPPRVPTKNYGVRLSPLPGKDVDWEGKELSKAKRPGPSKAAAVRNICAKTLRPSDKIIKVKHRPIEEAEIEKKIALNTVSLGLNCPDQASKSKLSPHGEPSSFKQSPKRLKICKNDGDARSKRGEWKRDSIEGDLSVFSKASRGPSTSADPAFLQPSVKKRVLKTRTQVSPLKYKKSLEKRRISDKKNKILYKKAGKLALSSSELAKSERKRRNVIPNVQIS